MFFYESFGTGGVPELLVNFIGANFPDEVGSGFSKMGMVRDPTVERDRPLGLAPSRPLGNVETVAFTCASCHFGRLPDGRYAIGAPNHEYDYGGQILALILMPQMLIPGADPNEHHPDAIARVQPMLDRLNADRGLRGRFLLELLP